MIDVKSLEEERLQMFPQGFCFSLWQDWQGHINSSPSVQMPLFPYLTGQIPTQMTLRPTWTHTLQPWGRGQGENCKSGISDTVLIAKSLLKFKINCEKETKKRKESYVRYIIHFLP